MQPTATQPTYETMNRTLRNRILRPQRHLLLLFFLLLVLEQLTEVQSQCYPVQIEIFSNDQDCQNGAEPAAVGRMYADGTCRATQVITSDTPNRTYSFPGRYVAQCNGADLEISDSGCTSNDCANANGGNICDREFSPASFYSRLQPPVYKLALDSSTSYRFCMLLTDSEGNDIIFTLVGDCTDSCGDRTAVPNTPPPSLKTPSPAPVSVEATAAPTLLVDVPVATSTPTSAEATATKAPSQAPVPVLVPVSSPTSQPSASGSESSGGGGSGGGGGTSTLRPTARSTTRTPTGVNPSVSEQQAVNNSNFTAIVAGSVVAGAMVVVLVLLAGFLLGVYRQRKRDARSASLSESEAGSHEDLRRMALGHGGGPGANIPVALASTTATARTPPMFESSQIIVPSGQDDDVSTLGTPLGVSFLDETTTVGGESSYRNIVNKLLGGEQGGDDDDDDRAAIERTVTEDTGDMFITGESKNMFSDDGSFDQQFDTENEPPSEPQSSIAKASDAAVNGSMHFVVTAPPGRLGMVIDDYFNVTGIVSPSSKLGGTAGTPTVHALKDDSILRQRGVKVGDLLETVDGMDVTDLNCLDVSRMITGKSAATRVLGFARQKDVPVNAEES
jgi:hypothetical protein